MENVKGSHFEIAREGTLVKEGGIFLVVDLLAQVFLPRAADYKSSAFVLAMWSDVESDSKLEVFS